MREIEFRARDIETDKFVYGSYIDHLEIIKNEHDSFDIDVYTLGQYTGLKDKNGTKIFEGDVVKICSQIGYIVCNCGSFGIGLSEGIDYKKLEKKTLSWLGIENDNFLPLLEIYWNFNDEDEILSEVKVIGNIYNNPELIGGAK